MKKIMGMAAAILLLSGCAADAQWETVHDSMEQMQPVWQETTYQIQHEIPEGMKLLYEREGERLYTDGASELSVQTFLAADAEDAVKKLSGYDASKLQIIQTERFGLPQYHFAWYSLTEEGDRLSRASLIMDGTACYAMVSSIPGDQDAEPTSALFSTFGLSADDGA